MSLHKNNKTLTVFEHQSIRLGQRIAGIELEPRHLEALEKFHGAGVPYFSLIHKGVKFNEFVGVVQVGSLTIEVLPKADQGNDIDRWRSILVGVLKVVGAFDIHAPSSASLRLKSNSILDLYIELFVLEVEGLLHRGLIKRYRKEEGNLTTLKGCIQFSRHIRTNLVHKERFYVRHTVYDQNHLLNRILYKALTIIQRVNTNVVLASRIGSLFLNFPEVDDGKISQEHFDRIVYERKTESYRKAIDIAKLLLLNYHPDLSKGSENVLAIMFDMNLLWERFVYRSLQKFSGPGISVEAQNNKDFWKPAAGRKVRMRPDIVINKDQDDCIVIDTKWKNLNAVNPSPDDLRQMYVYAKYYGACGTLLVYPGNNSDIQRGGFYDPAGQVSSQSCGVVTVQSESLIRNWQMSIVRQILG